MKPITIDDLFSYKTISNLKYSPNGKRILFSVKEINKENNKYLTYIYELRNNEPYKLTSSGKESSFIFLDDDTILFSGNRDEKKSDEVETIFYKLSLKGGEAVEAFRVPFSADDLLQYDENKFFFLATTSILYPDLFNASEDEKKKAKEEMEKNKDYYEISEVPFVSNGAGYVNNLRSTLIFGDVKEKIYKRINPNYTVVQNYSLTKDKKNFVYIQNDFKDLIDVTKAKVYSLDLNNFKSREIPLPTGYIPSFFISASSFFYLFGVDPNIMGINSFQNVFICENEKISLINKDEYAYGKSIIGDVSSDADGFKVDLDDSLYFQAIQVNDGLIFKMNKDGKVERVFSKEGSPLGFDVYNSKLIISGMYGLKLQELYSEEGQLTHFNDACLSDRYLAKPEEVTFINENNTTIYGWVLKPIDYKKGKKYPVILDIHGGPMCAYGKIFFHEMQVWASKGYFVCYCNPTGSDGRGNSFANIMGKYGTVDYNDIMSFMDTCLDKYPDMDKDNLFETGGSYGGFMTNWIIGHTDRFKACVSQRSISNWSIMYGVSDIGYLFTKDQNLADPLHNAEKCWWHSPLKYALNVKTPTLFIHSSEDYRCPLQEGLSMFTALKVNGVETKIIIFKDENHELSRSGKPWHRKKRLEEITNWFESHKTVSQ